MFANKSLTLRYANLKVQKRSCATKNATHRTNNLCWQINVLRRRHYVIDINLCTVEAHRIIFPTFDWAAMIIAHTLAHEDAHERRNPSRKKQLTKRPQLNTAFD